MHALNLEGVKCGDSVIEGVQLRDAGLKPGDRPARVVEAQGQGNEKFNGRAKVVNLGAGDSTGAAVENI